MEIVRDTADRERFLDALYFLNDENKHEYWVRETESLPRFTRPDSWPKPRHLVDIHAWTLLDNHLHLLVQLLPGKEGGFVEFARRLFRSMTGYFNEKYGERGTIFQGPYKSILVETDEQLRYLIPYIVVKNTLEMSPQGLRIAEDFDRAWEWAKRYPFSSLGAYLGDTGSPILAKSNIISEIFPTEQTLKEASRDMLSAYLERRDDLRPLQMED